MMAFPPIIGGYLFDENSGSSTPTDESAAVNREIVLALPTVSSPAVDREIVLALPAVLSPVDARQRFLDEFQASVEASRAKHIEAMAGMQWIGKMVAKHNMKGTEPLLGGVVDYIIHKKRFQVVYQDGSTETLDIDKLRDRRSLAMLFGGDKDDIAFDANLWSKGGDQHQEAGDDDEQQNDVVLAAGARGITARASNSSRGDKCKGVAAKPKTKRHTTPRKLN